MGPGVTINFNSPPETDVGRKRNEREEEPDEQTSKITSLKAVDIVDLTEAVMSCSVASPSREIREVLASSDLVVTGLKELEDMEMGMQIAQRPLLVIPEKALPSRMFTERAVIWSQDQNILPMVQRIVES